MRLLNCKDPIISQVLLPWYVPVDKTELEIGWELNQRLKNNPDDTFCCVAIENNRIQGFLVAYCRESDVFLWQARSNTKHPKSREYVDLIFYGLAQWAKAKGYNRFCASSPRNKALKRRLGFVDTDNPEIIGREI